mmetsp:Transcript_92939/g.258859  ORF Transcript_92939/g.258859 Transcript_92939/m.258859 type:complete len:106 (+) Transcript_92939:128-445(+)
MSCGACRRWPACLAAGALLTYVASIRPYFNALLVPVEEPGPWQQGVDYQRSEAQTQAPTTPAPAVTTKGAASASITSSSPALTRVKTSAPLPSAKTHGRFVSCPA